MNLFILDKDPIIAAQYNCDKHVIKIILEAKQMLDYAHEYSKSPYYYNPVAKWVREFKDNYIWTCKHAIELCHQYNLRYHKIHAYEYKIIGMIWKDSFKIPEGYSDFYQAVPDDCKRKDPVEAYRLYYLKYKMHFAKWKNGNIPPFVMA